MSQVPDFDKVTCTVAMPTDNVGCIRRRLEQSQRRFLSNANLNSDRVLTADLKKVKSFSFFLKSKKFFFFLLLASALRERLFLSSTSKIGCKRFYFCFLGESASLRF